MGHKTTHNNYLKLEDFIKLKKCVFQGDEKGINLFFEKYITNHNAKQELMRLMQNESYFFSFHLSSFNNIEYTRESSRRYNSVFKYFSTAEQVKLIYSMFLDWDKSEYMHLIKTQGIGFMEPWGSYNENTEIAPKETLYLASKFLAKKLYDSLLLLKEKIPPLLDFKASCVPIYYGTKFSTGCFFVYANKDLYRLRDSLIVNFCNENILFFQKHGWGIESNQNEIQHLHDTVRSIMQSSQEYQRFSEDYSLEENVNKYKNLILSKILENKLEHKLQAQPWLTKKTKL